MNRLIWHNWRIAPRISLVTVTPVILMFLAIVAYLAISYRTEVQDELRERGNVVVSAVARASEFGVVTGSRDDLHRAARDTIRTDPDIVSVRISDANDKVIIELLGHSEEGSNDKEFHAPIMLEPLARGTDSAEGASIAKPQASQTLRDVIDQPMVVGHASIIMSPARMLNKQWHRLYVGALIAGIALLASAILGLYLARSVTDPLAETSAALRQIRSGDYQIEFHHFASGEIGDLQAIIQHMSANLKEFRKDLESRVQARTRDLEEARDKYVRANMEKKILITKLNSIAEEERKLIAIELHDELNASLIVMRLEAQRILSISNDMPTTPAVDDVRALARSITKRASDLYTLARGIVKRLRPEIIDTMGLRDALEEIVRHYDDIHPNCRFEFRATQDFTSLKVEYALVAYRLVQEALSNVVKHSHASRCQVRLRRIESRHRLRIHVRDDGIGYHADHTDGGIGLIGMRERVYSVGGRLKVFHSSDNGTAIVIDMPFVTREAHAAGETQPAHSSVRALPQSH